MQQRPICPYCQGPIDEPLGPSIIERQVGVCPGLQCRIPHHLLCWQTNKGCTTLGCPHAPNPYGYTYVGLAEIRTLEDKQARIAEALKELEEAIKGNDDDTIIRVWDSHSSLLHGQILKPEWQDRIIASKKRRAAMAALTKAVAEPASDLAISDIWRKVKQLFDQYPISKALKDRVDLAEARRVALDELRDAFAKAPQNVVSMYSKYQALLDACPDFTEYERQQVRAQVDSAVGESARKLQEAIWLEDDLEIANVWLQSKSVLKIAGILTTTEEDRAELACKRANALVEVRRILRDNNILGLRLATKQYLSTLEGCRNFGPDERYDIARIIQDIYVQDLGRAIRGGSSAEIVQAGDSAIREGCVLSANHQKEIATAKLAIASKDRLAKAITNNDEQEIVAAAASYPLAAREPLDQSSLDRVLLAGRRLERFIALEVALSSENDQEIARLYDPKLFEGSTLLTPDQQKRCELAVRRRMAYSKLRAALNREPWAGNPLESEQERDILAPSRELTALDKYAVQQFWNEKHYIEQLDNALKNADSVKIVAAYREAIEAGVFLPDDKKYDGLQEILSKENLLSAFRHELAQPHADEEHVAYLGQRIASFWPQALSVEEQQRINTAAQRTGALYRLRSAIKSKDNRRIVAAYDRARQGHDPVLTNEEWLAVRTALDAQPLGA